MSTKRAIHLIPDTSGTPAIEEFRRLFDPLFEHIAAHITLVYPFDLPVTDAALVSHCRSCGHGIRPYTVTLHPPSISDDAHFWLPVGHSASLIELTKRLHSGPLSPLASTERDEAHHITIARPPLPSAIHEAFARHEITFPVSLDITSFTLEAIQPDDSSLVIASFPL